LGVFQEWNGMRFRLPLGAIVLALSLILGSLSGCGLLPEEKDETGNWSVNGSTTRPRSDAGRQLPARDQVVRVAREPAFRMVRMHSSRCLQLGYSNYKLGEMSAAISAADRFIKQYPNHQSVDYAYYLKGLANFNDDFGFLPWLAAQDLSERDPKTLRESFAAFRDLVAKFPDSRYAADSKQRMNFLINSLASGEVHVARYYYNRGAYIASASRAQQAVLTYPNAPAIEEALWLMVSAYDKLSLNDLRDDAKRVLVKNFPQSKYLTGDTGSSWWKFW
jgi:outer membrane protein assembly factor BamD